MKKILLLLFLSLTYNQIFSQDKKVLFEQFTNASCAPCAQVNPYFREYFDSKGDTVISIKYHTQYPGYDPMYLENAAQVNERGYTYYPDIFGVPWLKADGNVYADIFDSDTLEKAYETRKAVIPKLLISVIDQRIAGDSIKATVTINMPQDLPAGNYKLRTYVTEKFVQYAAPPGTNGETYFPGVFRLGVPDMTELQYL